MAATQQEPEPEVVAQAGAVMPVDDLLNVGDFDIDVSHGNDVTEDSDGEDLVLAASKPMSSDDDGFQEIIDELEQLMMDESLNDKVSAFMQKHCHEFEDGEENKLVYTSLFNEYTTMVETLIAERLGGAVAGFSMQAFCAKLGERYTELPPSLEELSAFGDFAAFKEMMLSCKRGQECGVDGPLLVVGGHLMLHTDEQEDGVEMPDLNLQISAVG